MAEIYDCCVIGKEDGGKTMLKLFVVKNKKFAKDDEEALTEKSSSSASKIFLNGLSREKLFI